MILFKNFYCGELSDQPLSTCFDNISRMGNPLVQRFLNLTCGIDQIIPERKKELEEFANLNLTINLDTSTYRYRFSVNPRESTAFVSLAALERLWAYLYFYLSAVKIYQSERQRTDYNISDRPAMAHARRLAIWAQRTENANGREEWPEAAPSPYLDQDDPLKDEVNRYFDYVCCFMVLHELAHVKLNHQPVQDLSEAQREELEADRMATDLMTGKFQDLDQSPLIYTGRCAGVLTGLAALASNEFYKQVSRRAHPQIAERISRALEIMEPSLKPLPAEQADFAAYFAASIVHSHLINAGIPVPDTGPYETVDDFLLAAYVALRQHSEG